MSQPPTSVSPKTAEEPKTGTRRRWLYRNRWPISLLSLAALAILGFVYFQFTYVSGVEINSKNFHLRSFSFRRDPFTNFQLSGISHSHAPHQYRVWTDLQYDSSIDPAIAGALNSPRSQNRWDLVYFDQAMSRGEASILVELLSLTDSQYKLYWPDWSARNPKLAPLFWPVVQEFAALELYAKLPSIFEVALLDLPPKQFSTRLHESAATILLDAAKQRLQAGKEAEAASIARLGLQYGDDPELLALAGAPANTTKLADPSDEANDVQAEIESFDRP